MICAVIDHWMMNVYNTIKVTNVVGVGERDRVNLGKASLTYSALTLPRRLRRKIDTVFQRLGLHKVMQVIERSKYLNLPMHRNEA